MEKPPTRMQGKPGPLAGGRRPVGVSREGLLMDSIAPDPPRVNPLLRVLDREAGHAH